MASRHASTLFVRNDEIIHKGLISLVDAGSTSSSCLIHSRIDHRISGPIQIVYKIPQLNNRTTAFFLHLFHFEKWITIHSFVRNEFHWKCFFVWPRNPFSFISLVFLLVFVAFLNRLTIVCVCELRCVVVVRCCRRCRKCRWLRTRRGSNEPTLKWKRVIFCFIIFVVNAIAVAMNVVIFRFYSIESKMWFFLRCCIVFCIRCHFIKFISVW